jgi:glycerol-3-phosphate dehydrogenase
VFLPPIKLYLADYRLPGHSEEHVQISIPNRQPLTGQHFQVAVVGGGLIGMAIARECARAGKRTLLVEQHDFGWGAATRTSRIVSGFSALESGDAARAREIVRDRETLLREYPHLFYPSHFLMAVDGSGSRGALSTRAKLWLYRQITGSRLDAASFEIEHKKLERAIGNASWSLFDFEDVVCPFPERLLAEWLREAEASGAVVRNHTQVLAVDIAHGRARGLLLRDWIANRAEKIEATWIVNASGAWASRLCQRSSLRLRRPISTNIRSTYLVTAPMPGTPSAPVCTETSDGKPLTIVPWNDQLLVGPIETVDASDPAKVNATADVHRLQQTLLELFSKTRVMKPEARFAFSAIRSTPARSGSAPENSGWEHTLHDHSADGAARMITVVGGTMATAIRIARDCAAHVGARPGETRGLPQRSRFFSDEWAMELAQSGFIPEDTARGILEWHGTRAEAIARLARGSVELRTPLCPHSPHIVAEVVHAYVHEHATSLADALLRRVPVALGACWSDVCSREAALRIGAVLGWSDEATGAALEALETERASIMARSASARRLGAAAD